jgi:LemA protein
MDPLVAILAVLAVLVAAIIVMFNRLVVLRNRTKEAWADIDVQLKRRYDLIPNLINTVKGYAQHESSLFEKVTEARTRAMAAEQSGDPKKIGEAENALAGTLKTLFAVAENYPNLRATENFQQLQQELSDTEDKVQAARRFYNSNVKALNIKTESFPSNIIAKMFGFKQMNLFEIENVAEREAPRVQF